MKIWAVLLNSTATLAWAARSYCSYIRDIYYNLYWKQLPSDPALIRNAQISFSPLVTVLILTLRFFIVRLESPQRQKSRGRYFKYYSSVKWDPDCVNQAHYTLVNAAYCCMSRPLYTAGSHVLVWSVACKVQLHTVSSLLTSSSKIVSTIFRDRGIEVGGAKTVSRKNYQL